MIARNAVGACGKNNIVSSMESILGGKEIH